MAKGKFWTTSNNELLYWPHEWGLSGEYFNALEKDCSGFDNKVYDSIFSFFMDNQPDLSLVYEDVYWLIRDARSDERIINLIRDKYPEIYNYKGNTMELQKEVTVLKQELAEEKAKLATLESAFKESQKPVTQTSVGTAVDNQHIKINLNDDTLVGVGTFESTPLPYPLWATRIQAKNASFEPESDEPKPIPQPTEVVYSIRIQPDSLLHAKIIKVLDHWEYDDALLGFEVDYILEQQ